MRKILILGNGFDLAHKLPTDYISFLRFLKLSTSAMVTWESDKCVQVDLKHSNNDQKKVNDYFDFCNRVGPAVEKEFRKIGCSSFWIQSFENRESVIGSKWLDLEEDIRIVSQEFAKDAHNSPDGSVQKITNQLFCEKYLTNKGSKRVRTFRDVFGVLQKDLDKVKRALEIYIDGYINTIQVDPISEIKNLKPDKLMTFNYSKIYTDNYCSPNEVCYVHGKADLTNNSNNMVLGFDDHYFDDNNTVPELIPFEKYYQRIVFHTDNNYFNWLNEIESLPIKSEVYIYGHSLAPSDGDIIKNFLSNKKVVTYIFYLNDVDRAEKIRNLAIILGPQQLIQLAGGPNPAIIWIKIK